MLAQSPQPAEVRGAVEVPGSAGVQHSSALQAEQIHNHSILEQMVFPPRFSIF